MWMGKGFVPIGLAAVAVGVLVGAGLAAPVATIVPGVSLAGIQIGDTGAIVRAAVGAPAAKRFGAVGSGTVVWKYPAHNGLVVTFDRGKVASVEVSAEDGDKIVDQTATGVGLLTPISAVAKAYPRKCGFEQGFLPLCRWTTPTTQMIFLGSDDSGSWRNAPILSIELRSND